MKTFTFLCIMMNIQLSVSLKYFPLFLEARAQQASQLVGLDLLVHLYAMMLRYVIRNILVLSSHARVQVH